MPRIKTEKRSGTADRPSTKGEYEWVQVIQAPYRYVVILSAVKIPYADNSITIDSFERKSFDLLSSRDVGSDRSKRQQIQVFLAPSQDQEQDDNIIAQRRKLAKETSGWLNPASSCQIIRSRTDSISPMLDVLTSSTRRMVGLVKCCHSWAISGPLCEPIWAFWRVLLTGYDREYFVRM